MSRFEHQFYFVYLSFFTISLDTTLIVSYTKTDDFTTCWIPKSRVIATSAAFLISFAFFLNLCCGTYISTRKIRNLAFNLTLVANLLILLSAPYLLLNTIFTPHCINIFSMIALWLIFGGINFILYILILLVCIAGCVVPIIYYYERQKMERERREVEQIYTNIYQMSDAQIDRFLENHEDFISNSFELNNEEKAVLKDKFSKTCCTNQEDRQENQRLNCAICISDFKESEEFIYHPGCLHLFHSACIEEWFKERLVCPICKQNTRKNLIESFKRGGGKENKGSKKNEFWVKLDTDKRIQYLITKPEN